MFLKLLLFLSAMSLRDTFSEPLISLGYDLDSLVSNGKILEAGCQFGDLVAELRICNPYICGVDYDTRILQKIRENSAEYAAIHGFEYYPNILMADVARLPFRDNSFDLIISRTLFASTGEREIIEALRAMSENRPYELSSIFDMQNAMIRELYRVLKQGGIYLLFDNRSVFTLPLLDFKQLYPEKGRDFKLILQK